MAIDVPDQQRVTLGGSSVAPRDTYSTPGIDRGPERNAEALARALEGFGNTMQGLAVDNRERKNKVDAANIQAFATPLAEAIQRGEAAEVALGNIAPNLSYLNRVATQQAAGNLLGSTIADKVLMEFPDGLTDQPEELAKWYTAKKAEVTAQYKDNPFLTAGLLETLNTRFGQHQSNMFAKANADSHNTQKTAFATSVGNIIETTIPPKPTPDKIRTGAVPPPSPTAGYQINTGGSRNPSAANALVRVSNGLGINPYELAMLISYETGGTFSPDKWGGKNGNHQGLIQFGEWERKKYGIRKGMTFEEQIEKVGEYLRDRGARPGDDLLQLYSIVNAGSRDLFDRSDGRDAKTGKRLTVRDHADRIRNGGRHAANAALFLTGSTDTRLITASGRPINEKTGSIEPPKQDEPSIFNSDEPDHLLNPDVIALRNALMIADAQAEGAANPQLTRRERKKIMLDAVIRKATQMRDDKWLYAIPESMLDPEERDLVANTREQIRTFAWQDYQRKRQMDKDKEADERENNTSSILADVAAGKTIDALTDPRIMIGGKRDASMVKLIGDLYSLPRVAPYLSQNREAEISSAIETYAGTNNVQGLRAMYPNIRGGDVEGQLRAAIIADPSINPDSKNRLVSNLGALFQQGAKVNDPIVKNAYTVSSSVQAAMTGPFGKILPPTLSADMEGLFRTRVQSGIRSWYADNPGKSMPTSVLQQIADDANTYTYKEFSQRYTSYTNGSNSNNGEQPGDKLKLKRTVRADGTIVYSN